MLKEHVDVGVTGRTEVLVGHVVGAAGHHQRGHWGHALVGPGAGRRVLHRHQLGDQHAPEVPRVVLSDGHPAATHRITLVSVSFAGRPF